MENQATSIVNIDENGGADNLSIETIDIKGVENLDINITHINRVEDPGIDTRAVNKAEDPSRNIVDININRRVDNPSTSRWPNRWFFISNTAYISLWSLSKAFFCIVSFFQLEIMGFFLVF